MKNVLILGCGPAGLFAAHAATLSGMNPVIVSKKRKSEMFGAQYLHQPIPEVSGDPFDVSYELHGEVAGYREKVYGPGFRGTTSPEDLGSAHEAWDIRAAYDNLWLRYVNDIENFEFRGSEDVHALIQGMPNISHYVSTIPAQMLCIDQTHQFQAQKVWAIGDAPERGIFSPVQQPLNTVVCSGERDVSWYRSANILGYHTTEWPEKKRPPIEGISPVAKPIGTNCNCAPMVHRVGRYGTWTKGVLSHEAFYQTYFGLAGKPWS